MGGRGGEEVRGNYVLRVFSPPNGNENIIYYNKFTNLIKTASVLIN